MKFCTSIISLALLLSSLPLYGQQADSAARAKLNQLLGRPASAAELTTHPREIAPATASETVLHSFNPYARGAYPQASVCQGPGGNFYGTTSNGGSTGAGVVFKLDARGRQTVLYSFTGGADGAYPYAGVICESEGNIYGTTAGGGSAGAGVVFRVDGAGHETVLYSFTGGTDGGYPGAGLIEDWAGNFYGTTGGGGASGAGAVFKLDRRGNETVLYSFTGGVDGGYPEAGLIQDLAGNLYGTTSSGGASGAGVVFKLDRRGNETVLYSFTGGADGGYSYAGLIQDLFGNLYGTGSGGGASGAGVVFKLDRRGNETVLYSFTGGADGGYPYAGVVQDFFGNLYGTTCCGGASFAGVVFKLDRRGNETVLHSFTGGADGGYSYAGLIQDLFGNLYGTASGGGAAGAGVVFKVDTRAHESVLYSFPGSDGSNPVAGVIEDAAGNFYGTTIGGGPANSGVVYKVDATGHESVLYSFTGGSDGGRPSAALIQDAAGNFYGTTQGGGAFGAGVVYKLDATGHESVLYSFTGGADGANPAAALIQDAAGNFYGTTQGGGVHAGVVYKLDTTGHETVLYNFTGGADGGTPVAGVTLDAAGNLYGTTCCGGSRLGVVYKLDPAGNYTVLHSFTCGNDGCYPLSNVTLDAAGNLYGATWSGGSPQGDDPGVVYKVDSAGNFSVLYPFTGFADGGGSRSTLVFDASGNLYGTTQYGGQGPCPYFGCGVVFELDPTGNQTVLYRFTGGSDGSEPQAGVTRDASGNLYGTTAYGGTTGAGVVYKLTPGAGSPAVAQSPERLFDGRGLVR